MGQFSKITQRKDLEMVAKDLFFITKSNDQNFYHNYEYIAEGILMEFLFQGDFPRCKLFLASLQKNREIFTEGKFAEGILVYLLFDTFQTYQRKERKPITDNPLFSHLPKDIFGKYMVEIDSVEFDENEYYSDNPCNFSSRAVYFGLSQNMRLDVFFMLVPIDPESGLKKIAVGAGIKFYSNTVPEKTFKDNFLSADPRLAFVFPKQPKFSNPEKASIFKKYWDSQLDKQHCIILSFIYGNQPPSVKDADKPFDDGKGGYYIPISRNTFPFTSTVDQRSDMKEIKKFLDEKAKIRVPELNSTPLPETKMQDNMMKSVLKSVWEKKKFHQFSNAREVEEVDGESKEKSVAKTKKSKEKGNLVAKKPISKVEKKRKKQESEHE